VLVSLCYRLLHHVLWLAVRRWRSADMKELEIVGLRLKGAEIQVRCLSRFRLGFRKCAEARS
jgi:hypothetical protein